MIITFEWPSPRHAVWSEEAAISLLGKKVSVDGRKGKVIGSHLDSEGLLQITINIKETADESLGHPV